MKTVTFHKEKFPVVPGRTACSHQRGAPDLTQITLTDEQGPHRCLVSLRTSALGQLPSLGHGCAG